MRVKGMKSISLFFVYFECPIKKEIFITELNWCHCINAISYYIALPLFLISNFGDFINGLILVILQYLYTVLLLI